MKRHQMANVEESSFPFRYRFGFGACKILVRVFLAVLALILLLNPLAGQGVRDGQIVQRDIQPAYMLHGHPRIGTVFPA
ncbi:MAG: hypothetical protein ABSC60_18870 [Acidobacteriota bacterium]